jgi:hypothetical protein
VPPLLAPAAEQRTDGPFLADQGGLWLAGGLAQGTRGRCLVPNKKRRRYRRRSWCTSRGSAHFDWHWRERPALALLAWDTRSRSDNKAIPRPLRHFDLPQIQPVDFHHRFATEHGGFCVCRIILIRGFAGIG